MLFSYIKKKQIEVLEVFMKKMYLSFAFFILAAFTFGCTTGANSSANSSKQNSTNSAVNQNVSTVNSNDNTNVNQNNSVSSDQNAPPAEVENYSDANAALEAGKKFFDNNEEEKAIQAFEQATKLDPNLGEAFFRLGISYEIREKTDETPAPVVKTSKNKKAVLPDKPSDKAYKSAIKAYESFLKKNPKDAGAHFNLGLAYEKIDEDQKSEKSLQQAVKLQPQDSEYKLELGQILIKLAKYEEASSVLKKALQIDPDNLRIEDALGKSEAGRKRVEAGKPKEKPPVK
jgi:tetratricopeptide (TPR) repeat protein